MQSKIQQSKVMLILSMLIFGTIGIFRRYIPLSSAVIALARGLIGTIFLALFLLLRGKKLSFAAIRKNLLCLILSGVCIGFNWILLFEAYQYTSVSISTLCYYMAPILVILISALLYREKLTGKKIVSVILALVGMTFVSGILENGISGTSQAKGILYGLGAAVLYATVVLLNKKLEGIAGIDRTLLQLFIAAVVLLPYVCLSEQTVGLSFTVPTVLLLLVVGVLHTGAAYALYFTSMEHLSSQTIALCSYLDPVTAIILATVIFHETMSWQGIVGAVMILGAMIWNENE